MCVLIDNICVSLTHFTLYNKLQGISYHYPVPASVHLCSRCQWASIPGFSFEKFWFYDLTKINQELDRSRHDWEAKYEMNFNDYSFTTWAGVILQCFIWATILAALSKLSDRKSPQDGKLYFWPDTLANSLLIVAASMDTRGQAFFNTYK